MTTASVTFPSTSDCMGLWPYRNPVLDIPEEYLNEAGLRERLRLERMEPKPPGPTYPNPYEPQIWYGATGSTTVSMAMN